MTNPLNIVKHRVLMVDDDQVDRMAFERFIKNHEDQFQYEICDSVAEATTIIQNKIFDVIISDYMLGDGTAFDLFEQAKTTPFILITGVGDQEVAVRALKDGAYDYLVKDQSAEFYNLLLLSLETTLGRKRNEVSALQNQQELERLIDVRTKQLKDENDKANMINHALRESEGRWRSFVEQSPDVVMQLSTAGTVVFVNRNLGVLSISSMMGKSSFDIVAQDCCSGKLKESFEEAIKGKTVSFDCSLLNDQGVKTWRNTRLSPVYSGHEHEYGHDIFGIIMVISDISERKKNELELVLERQNAENANKAKSNFLTMMSHELRTPMNGVLGMAQLLLLTELTAEQKEWCDIILKSGNRLVDLLSNILNIAKIEAGKETVKPSPISISSIIGSIVDLFSGSAISKRLELSSNIDPQIQKTVIGDEELLLRVLSNLVGNAIKFTPKGTISINVEVVEQNEKTQKILFQVKDTGIGLSEEQKQHIFEPFQQGDDKTTRKYGGSGLGLAIAKQLIVLMGSKIQLESTEGMGCNFSFALTMEISTKATEQESAPQIIEESKAPKVDSLNALVVEDDEVNQVVIRRMLSKQNISVEFSKNGKEALLQTTRQRFDFIFMDLLMPVMDGYEATKTIRKMEEGLNRETPIIAITAMASEQDKEKCFEVGMNEYLSKPIDYYLLENTVQKYIALMHG